MKARCGNCDYLFEREPGYFLGAMYISYALAVFKGTVAFLICYFFFEDVHTLTLCFAIVGVILLFSRRNYRL